MFHLSTALEWWLLVGCLVVLAGLVTAAARRWLREDEWTVEEWRRPASAGELDPDAPWCPGCGFANYSVSACEVCGHDDQGTSLTAVEWEQLDPDTAADTLIAEWHHEPMEHKADTDTMGLMDDAELLLWDIRRQHALIQALRGRWRVEMAGLDAWYRAELEHRRASVASPAA